MQAIIIQPEIQAAAVPTTSCSLIRRFTGGNALAKQSLTTYRLRCKAVDCCETLHHRIIDWQRMSMCTCWCCLIRFSCRRIRLADVVTTTSRLLGRNCHTMRMGTITLSSTGMGMGRHFTDGAIWPSVNLHCTITLVAPWTLLASWAHLSEACSLTAQMEPLLLLRIVLPIGEIMAHNTFQELLILMLQKDGLAPHHL